MNKSTPFEDIALNVDTTKTRNLELLLGAYHFAKFLGVEEVTHHHSIQTQTKCNGMTMSSYLFL